MAYDRAVRWRGIGVAVVVVAACADGDTDRQPGTFGLPPDATSTGAQTSDDTPTSTGTTDVPTSTSTSSAAETTAGDGNEGTGDSTGANGPVVPACPGPGAPLDCSPGPGSGEADTCVDDPSCFLQLVQASVNAVIADTPQWFDQSDGQPFVLEVELYMDEVVARVAAAGQCAIRDPNAGDEIAVKHDNAFAENFDILTAEGYARYGNGIYTSKCIPAWF